MAIPKLSIKAAIEQVEKCDFECEGGPLKLNIGWMALKEAAAAGPEYWPGQSVWFEITAETAGKKLTQWVLFEVVGLHKESSSESAYWTYDLSYDPPSAYHYGTVHFTHINGDRLRLEDPSKAGRDQERANG